jgi:hypothetical protein
MRDFLIYSGEMVYRKENQPQSPQRTQSFDAFLCVLCALCGFSKHCKAREERQVFTNIQ